MQSTRYVFTINNYSQFHVDLLQKLQCKFLVFGKEQAPTTGTQHLQGYVEFTQRKRRTAVSKLIPNAFLESAKAPREYNIGYCTKSGDYWISDQEYQEAFQKSSGKVFPEFYSNDYLSQCNIRLDFFSNNDFFENEWNKCLEYHINRDKWYNNKTGSKWYHLKQVNDP